MVRLSSVPILIAAASVMLPPALGAQEPPTLRLTREMKIDAAEHDLTPITPPGGLTVGPNGTIAFSQNQDGTVRFFDARGRPLGSFGRKGQGPGEFMTTSRFAWVGDTLLASDASTRRFTIISPDRKLVRTIPWLASAALPPKAGAEPPRLRVSIPQMRYADGSQLVSLTPATGSAAPDWPGGEKPGTPFARVDSLGAFQRLIGWRPNVDCFQSYDAGNGPGSGRLNIPFCAQALDEAAPDGSRFFIAFVEQGTPAFRVTAFDQSGDTVFTRRLPYQPIMISSATRDSARAARARGTTGQREAAAKMQIPETHPPYLRLLAGRDGTAWLERSTGRGEHSWIVLDASGNPHGVVTVPATLRIMAVTRDLAWAIETDADGLQHVVRYRVSR